MPGLKGALAVRINDGQTGRTVTRYCRGLKFTKVAPGGHKGISVHVNLPRNTFNSLGPEDRIYVHDTRTTRTIVEGYLENPTPTDGIDGQSYDLSAVGGMALLNDETRALIYITGDVSDWEMGAPLGAAVAYTSGTVDVNGTGLRVQFASGNTVPNANFVSASSDLLQRAGMNIGAVRVESYSGQVDAGYYLAMNAGGTGIVIGDLTPRITTSHVVDTKYVSTHFPATLAPLVFYIYRQGVATNVTVDTVWSQLDGISVLGQRMDRNGTLLTGSAGLVSATQVLASQVVEDLLGRLMTFCDPGAAQVDATLFGITQLAYPDGVKAAGVLNDLAVFEPDFLWEILETLDNGKHRFNYRAWPTTPRYEVSIRDDWRQAGSDVDLCNRILVSYTDPAGKVIPVPVTAASLGLVGIGLPVDALGTRVKDADPITLPAGSGSAANATRIGGQILTDKINPPKAATVLVRRPIIDLLTGNQVMPWEIEPGYLCRVRETGDDMRITQVEYDDDTVASVLTLGRPVLTDEQRLAQLDRATQTVLVGV